MAYIKRKKNILYEILLYGIFFTLTFLYILLLVEPELYFQHQEPAFYFESQFFSRYTVYPGGILEYFSAFFAQYYLIPVIGTIIIVLSLLGITLLTKYFLYQIKNSVSAGFIHFIPAILLIMIHGEYDHSLAGTFGLLFALLIYAAYNLIPIHQVLIRTILYILLMPLLYYICAGPAFFFALLCILFIFINDSQKFMLCILQTSLFLIIALSLPFISFKDFTIAPLYEKLTHNLIIPGNYRQEWLPFLLYGFYPLSFLILRMSHIQRRLNISFYKKITGFWQVRIVPFWSGFLEFIFNLAGLLILSGIAIYFSYDPVMKINHQVIFKAHDQKWDQVLLIAQNQKPIHFITDVQVNLALYHRDLLLENMFSYPQDWGSIGLLIPQEYGHVFPLQISDLFFDLGFITESQHWAYEAQALHKDSPWNLQRLFLTHLLKGNSSAARRYLYYLDRSLVFQKWINRQKIYLDDLSAIKQDSYLQQKFNWMPRRDFIAHTGDPDSDLKALLENNPDNKMAFEYYMAHCLLTRQLNQISSYRNYLTSFRYRHIPTHLEEAFLIYLFSKKSRESIVAGYQIRRATINKFNEFIKIVNRYRRDKKLMIKVLREGFSKTYWFYYYLHQERNKKEISIPALSR